MVAKKTPAKKAKKTPTKKTPTKKASAKKTPDKKASAKKTPVARKAPAPAKKAAPSKKAVREPQKADSGDESYRAPTPEEGGGVDVHEAYLQYRLGGAERAERLDPDVYRRATEEWQSLPGAFRTTPPPAAESETTGDEPTPDEANEGEPS